MERGPFSLALKFFHGFSPIPITRWAEMPPCRRAECVRLQPAPSLERKSARTGLSQPGRRENIGTGRFDQRAEGKESFKSQAPSSKLQGNSEQRVSGKQTSR